MAQQSPFLSTDPNALDAPRPPPRAGSPFLSMDPEALDAPRPPKTGTTVTSASPALGAAIGSDTLTPDELDVIGRSPATQAAQPPLYLPQPVQPPVEPPPPAIGSIRPEARQVGRGLAALVRPFTHPPVLPVEPHVVQPGGPATDQATLFNAGSDLLEGAAQMGTPFALVGAVANLPATAGVWALSYLASLAAGKAADLADATPEQKRFAQNVASTATALGGAKVVLDGIAAIPEAAQAAARPRLLAGLLRVNPPAAGATSGFGPGDVPGYRPEPTTMGEFARQSERPASPETLALEESLRHVEPATLAPEDHISQLLRNAPPEQALPNRRLVAGQAPGGVERRLLPADQVRQDFQDPELVRQADAMKARADAASVTVPAPFVSTDPAAATALAPPSAAVITPSEAPHEAPIAAATPPEVPAPPPAATPFVSTDPAAAVTSATPSTSPDLRGMSVTFIQRTLKVGFAEAARLHAELAAAETTPVTPPLPPAGGDVPAPTPEVTRGESAAAGEHVDAGVSDAGPVAPAPESFVSTDPAAAVTTASPEAVRAVKPKKGARAVPQTPPDVLEGAVSALQAATEVKTPSSAWSAISDFGRQATQKNLRNVTDAVPFGKQPERLVLWHVERLTQRGDVVSLVARTYDTKTGKPQTAVGDTYQLRVPAGWKLPSIAGTAEPLPSPVAEPTVAEPSHEAGTPADSGVGTGQLPERGTGTARPAGAARPRALGEVSPEPGEGVEGAGPARAGHGDSESVVADGVPRPSRDGAESEAARAPSRGPVPESVAVAPAGDTHDPGVAPADYHLTSERIAAIVGRGDVTRAKDNLAAIELVKQLAAEDRYATPAEQETLAKYVGWGATEMAAYLDDRPGHDWSANKKGIWERLQKVLTEDERRALIRSTPNAHFTFELYRPIWQALERAGFTGGRVLEPAVGTGHAFGFMPPAVRVHSTLNGVELEPITAAIAHHLYPSARIQPVGYELARLARGTQDLVVSNVPFGDFGVRDPLLPEVVTARIHNYFFAKALEHVRPGGLVVFVTSRYTMDGPSHAAARRYLMERANFIGAVRLPNTAFDKSAKTEVITDVIVLRRLLPDETPNEAQAKLFIEAPKSEALSGKATSGFGRKQKESDINVYRSSWYDTHPELILGTEAREGTMRAGGEYTVTAKGKDILDPLAEALGTILPPGTYTPAAEAAQQASTRRMSRVADDAYKPGELRVSAEKGRIERVLRDGSIEDATPMRVDTETGQREIDKGAVKRVAGMIEIRNALRDTVAVMQTRDSTEAEVAAAQKKLRDRYNRFVLQFKDLNTPTNRRLFKDDPEVTNLMGLERLEPKATFSVNKKGVKVLSLKYQKTGLADIFTKRTLNPPPLVTHVDTPKEALFASLGMHGQIDWPYMEGITGATADALQTALAHEGLVFEQPDGAYVLAEEYLSGDVVSKLEDVQAAHDATRFAGNIAALTAVQPPKKTRDDIASGIVSIGMGAHWVPPEDLANFVKEQLGVRSGVSYGLTGTQAIVRWEGRFTDQALFSARRHPLAVRYNGDANIYDFVDLVNDALNLKQPHLGHYEGTGKERYFVREPEAELAARANQETLREAWQQYVFAHETMQDQMLDTFNVRFNRTVERTFDGSHMTYPGMATIIDSRGNTLKFFPHQNRGVWRIISTGNTLLAHEVGAGKTYEMIAAAMEMRRTGRAQKPMITVPTYLLQQWQDDILRLYPTAKLLAFSEKDLSADKRQTAMARIAFGNWDIVLVPHSSFGLLKVSDARVIGVMQEWIDELSAAEAAGEEGSDSVKEMERQRRRIEDKVAKKSDKINKGNDNALTWEQLGVDALFVDEAQAFKNLFFFSKVENMRGLSKSESDRSLDLFVKVRDINEQSNYRNLVLATATPVMNSIAEIFTMQRYLQPQTLRHHGVENFDNWYAMFARALPTTESRPDGTYQEVMRLRDFQNLRTLSAMVREVMDYVGWEDMPYLKLPKIAGGRIEIVQTDPHPMYPIIKEWFASRLAAIRANPPHVKRDGTYVAPDRLDPITGESLHKHDNILTVMTDAKKSAVDVRLVLGDRAKDWPGSRLQTAADLMAEVYKAERAKKGLSLVFLDMGTPKNPPTLGFLDKVKVEDETEGALEEGTTDEEDDALAGQIEGDTDSFNLYDALKAALVKRGVPANEIAYIHQAKKPAERLALFQAANEGRIRFLFASTDKGGVGMNVQTRLAAIFEIDPPRAQRPGDLRQRMGRGIRQGNTYDAVRLVRFVTKGTTDEWLWGLLTTKDYQIRQFLKGQAANLTEDDPSTMSLSDAQMRASGDQRVIELTELKGKLARLEAQSSAAERAVAAARADVANGTQRKTWGERDLATLDAWVADHYQTQRKDGFRVTIAGKVYTDREEANDALFARLRRLADFGSTTDEEVGTIGDRPIKARFSGWHHDEWVDAKTKKVTRPESVRRQVAVTVYGSDIGAGDVEATTVLQPDNDSPKSLGLGQDAVASIVNTYERFKDYRDGHRTAIQKADDQIAQGTRVLEHPPAVIGQLKEAVKRIAALEHELKAEGAAQDKARDAAPKPTAEKPDETTKPKGGTTLQSTILPGAAEFGEHVVEPAVRAVAEQLHRQQADIRALFAPDTVSAHAGRTAGVLRANLAARAQRTQRAQQLLRSAEKLMDGWSHDESMAFWDVMEGLRPSSALDPAARPIAALYRDILDNKRDRELLPRNLIRSYLEHYWGHEWQPKASSIQAALRKLFGKRPLQGPESYRKRRSIPTMREGIQEFGLEPLSWNPTTQLLRKLLEMDKSIAAHDIRAELKARGEAKFIAAGKKAPDGWTRYPESFGTVYGPQTITSPQGEEVKIPFGRLVAGYYYGPRESVRLLENHLSPGLRGKSAAFDLYRVAGNFLTQLQLGLSAFHVVVTGMESIVSKQALVAEQVVRGQFGAAVKTQTRVPIAPLVDLVAGHKALKAFYAHDANAAVINDLVSQIVQGGGGFGWDLFEHTGSANAFMAALRATRGGVARGDVGQVAKSLGTMAVRAIPAAIELPTKAIMEGWVPRLKIAAFLDLARMELQTLGPAPDLEEVRRVLGGAWDSIDNRFGQLRYDNLFWHGVLKDLGMGSLRALGWHVGTLREMWGSVPAQFRQAGLTTTSSAGGGGRGKPPMRLVNTGTDKHGDPQYAYQPESRLHRKMAWFAAMFFIYGLAGAIYMYLRTGKRPEQLLDYYFPLTGETDKNGKPVRVSLPGYFKEFWATTHGFPGSAITSVKHWANPVLTLVTDLVTNEDFFGTEIRTPDDPILEQLGDAFTYAAKQYEPFSLRGAAQRGPGNLSTTESLIGILPAPASATRTAAETYLHGLQPPTHRTQQQAVQAQGRRDLRTARRAGDADAARTAIAEGQLSPRSVLLTAKSSRESPLVRSFLPATLAQGIKAYELATPEERRELQLPMVQKWHRLFKETPPDQKAALAARFKDAMALPVATRRSAPTVAAAAR